MHEINDKYCSELGYLNRMKIKISRPIGESEHEGEEDECDDNSDIEVTVKYFWWTFSRFLESSHKAVINFPIFANKLT